MGPKIKFRARHCLCALLTVLLVSVPGGHRQRSEAATPSVDRRVLDNQMVVLFSGQHQLPFVTIKLLIDAGSWRDPEKMGGLANLTAEAILLGTKNYSQDEINQELDFLGAELSTSCDRDYATVSFRVLTKHLDRGLKLFNEVLFRPVFPSHQISRKIREIKARIQSSQDRPDYVANRRFYQILFRQNPYGHPVEGTIESLSAIGRSDVADFHKRIYRPNKAILAIVGNLTPETVESEILAPMKKWAPQQAAAMHFENIFIKSPESARIDKPVSQANIIMGHPGIARGNDDYYKVSVMNQIFGSGGFTSRLLRKIRVKRGLAYSVQSVFVARKYPGSFRIIMQTKNKTALQAMEIAVAEMKKMREKPPTAQELETAKQYLIGSFPMRFDSQSELANYLVQIEFYELGLDYFDRYPSYIRAVSGDDVLRAAKFYLKPGSIVSSIVADLEKADFGKSPP